MWATTSRQGAPAAACAPRILRHVPAIENHILPMNFAQVWGIFPAEWHLPQLVCLAFCTITKSHLAEILDAKVGAHCTEKGSVCLQL